METHPIIQEIHELSHLKAARYVKELEYDSENFLDFKEKAKQKALDLIRQGEKIYDLDYFMEYIFVPHWQENL